MGGETQTPTEVSSTEAEGNLANVLLSFSHQKKNHMQKSPYTTTTNDPGDAPILQNILLKNKTVDKVFGDSDEESKGDTNRGALVSFGTSNGKPKIQISPKVLDALRHQWKSSLIMKLFGKTIDYQTLCSKVRILWNLQGEFKAFDLGENFFLFRFESLEDRLHVYTQGPYVVMDHFLSVRQWEPNFKPTEAQNILKTAVWVRFRELPVELFCNEILYNIAKVLGKPIKVDHSNQGHFARVCVEIDLSKPRCLVIEVEGKDCAVEYESLHSFCFKCDRLGHVKDINCDGATDLENVAPESNQLQGGSKPMEKGNLNIRPKETEIKPKETEKGIDNSSDNKDRGKQKPLLSTFWTECPHCNVKYEYYRDVINKTFLCQCCNKTFTGHETNDSKPKFSAKVNGKRKRQNDESSERSESDGSNESEKEDTIEKNGDVLKADSGVSFLSNKDQ